MGGSVLAPAQHDLAGTAIVMHRGKRLVDFVSDRARHFAGGRQPQRTLEIFQRPLPLVHDDSQRQTGECKCGYQYLQFHDGKGLQGAHLHAQHHPKLNDARGRHGAAQPVARGNPDQGQEQKIEVLLRFGAALEHK